MELCIMADGDEESVVDLQSWLAKDPGTARLPVTTVAGHGPTMSALEALNVVLSNTTDIANFTLAYVTWRSTRPPQQPGPAGSGGQPGGQRLVHGDSTVDIGHLSAEELAKLLRRLNGGTPSGEQE
ncbi:effector-associated constant component EACC1 [Streptomyces sp. NPDC056231]|uniref:effector-associated constant component EACC1 n=1 Tax=Streptomyces sp. NPDC056231 TaxID=3345755 RepID=UPI003AAAE2A6